MILFLMGEDFITYWIHRLFHGANLWKYHAVHHSSEELEWISAARFHPVNIFFGSVIADVALLLAGISPNVFVVLGPVTIAHSAFVHANLHWTLGPFKYVLAAPRLSSLASHGCGTRRRKEFCRHFPHSGYSIRHVLHAGRPASRPVRRRRQGVSDDLRRATCASVHG